MDYPLMGYPRGGAGASAPSRKWQNLGGRPEHTFQNNHYETRTYLSDVSYSRPWLICSKTTAVEMQAPTKHPMGKTNKINQKDQYMLLINAQTTRGCRRNAMKYCLGIHSGVFVYFEIAIFETKLPNTKKVFWGDQGQHGCISSHFE